jgi:hypothetical protein
MNYPYPLPLVYLFNFSGSPRGAEKRELRSKKWLLVLEVVELVVNSRR